MYGHWLIGKISSYSSGLERLRKFLWTAKNRERPYFRNDYLLPRLHAIEELSLSNLLILAFLRDLKGADLCH